MVYQHTTLVPTLIGAREPDARGGRRACALDVSGSRDAARRAGRRCSASRSTPPPRPATLALGQQQQIEIVKALWRGSKVLILDEPTSMLTPAGRGRAREGARAAEGARPGGRLHHAQAPRGDDDGRPRHGAEAGPGRRPRSSRRELRGAHPRRAPGRASSEMMFGEEAAPAPEVAELAERVEGRVAPRRALPDEAVLELDRVSVTPRARRDRRPGRLARGPPGRDPGDRGRRRERPARARRGDRRPAPARRRRRPLRAALSIRRLLRRAARAARPALRHRRPARRGHGRRASASASTSSSSGSARRRSGARGRIRPARDRRRRARD